MFFLGRGKSPGSVRVELRAVSSKLGCERVSLLRKEVTLGEFRSPRGVPGLR